MGGGIESGLRVWVCKGLEESLRRSISGQRIELGLLAATHFFWRSSRLELLLLSRRISPLYLIFFSLFFQNVRNETRSSWTLE